MSDIPGGRLIEALGTLNASGRCVVRTVDESGDKSSWQLNGSTWQAEVTVEMSRGLSLTFEATDPATDRTVNFDIDTDLYDISQPRNRAFAEEIESNIIEFVDNLSEGRMLRGRLASGPVLVFPLGGVFIRVVKGRFLTSSSTHGQESDALGVGEYARVI